MFYLSASHRNGRTATMATTLATLPDFIVTIDMAMHAVVDQTDEIGNVIRTIDFGMFSDTAKAINSWLYDQSPEDRDIWAPVMNTYLLVEFSKSETAGPTRATCKAHGHKPGDSFLYFGRAARPTDEGVRVTFEGVTGGVIRLLDADGVNAYRFGTAMKFWA
jgi:hypothetical protein